MSIPESYLCPITHVVMSDPVIDHEGNSYERSAIEQWLSSHNTSPITRQPLNISQLQPNRALRDAIQSTTLQPTINQDTETLFSPEQLRDTQLEINYSNNKLLLSITPPEGNSRTSVDLVCVIDTSGSMGTDAVLKNSSGQTESHGLSQLDVVKHAVKTIIHTLSSNDRLAIVSYSSQARTVLPLTKMDNDGIRNSILAIENLTPNGQTNIWDGLHTALELLRNSPNNNSLKSISLLTDGMPNIIPPRGHIPMLQKYRDQYSSIPNINTFGFGYSLDSSLLNSLSHESNGSYSFIPDSSFVGTIFVNSIANLLATCSSNTIIDIETLNGSQIISSDLEGIFPFELTSWGMSLNIGSIHFGQQKNIIIPFNTNNISYPNSYVSVKLRSSNLHSVEKTGNIQNNTPEILVHSERYNMISTIQKSMKLMNTNLNSAQILINNLISQLNSTYIEVLTHSSDYYSKLLSSIIKDVSGQIKEAFSQRSAYEKWGVHFIPSILNAHLFQMCNNFKDPGVQNYGSNLFKQIRDYADDQFCKLPPPKPSNYLNSYRPLSVGGAHVGAQNSTGSFSMRSYNSSSGPCFHGSCHVLMSNRTTKLVKNIRKGDIIMSPNNHLSKVTCVIKTVTKNKTYRLVNINGLLVTSWHPIKINNVWKFPCEISEPKKCECDAIYSFVLNDNHIMIINDTECVTLGHNFKEPVVSHPYFGSPSVINDLSKMKGWSDGFILLNEGCLVRNNITKLVSSIVQK